MADPFYDGLCAIPSTFHTRDGLSLRCKFEMGHGGDHSWKKYKDRFVICGGVFRSDFIAWFHKVPEGCTCKPLRTDDGEIVEYIFSADCVAHTPKTV